MKFDLHFRLPIQTWRITLAFWVTRFPSILSFLSVFCHPSADDEKKDMILQKRIKGFSWVTYEQLEVNVDFDNSGIIGLWEKAQKGLAKFSLFLTWFTKASTNRQMSCVLSV